MKRRTWIVGAAASLGATFSSAQGLGDAWRIGRSLPLSGAQSAYGEAKRDGGDAFAAAVNVRGGVAGKLIAFVTRDDSYDEKRTEENIASIASSAQPIAFAGFFGASQCATAAAQLGKLGIPGVGFTTGSNALREKPVREAFPVRASFAHETAAIVKHHRTTGVRRAVIAYVDIPFGRLARGSFEQAAQVDGLELMPPVELAQDAGNVRAAAAALRESGALVLMALHTPGAIALARELRLQQSQQQLWCLSAVDVVVLQAQLGANARGVATSIVVPTPSKLAVPLVREYLAATRAIQKPPTSYGLEAFLEMKTLAHGLTRTRLVSAPRDLTASLDSTGRFDLGGIEVQYGQADRTGSRYVDLVMISNAAVVGQSNIVSRSPHIA